MAIGKTRISFTEKKVSANAVAALILGAVLIIAHIGMMIYSIWDKGNIPFFGGVLETYIMLFSIFGLCWAALSFDDEKTTSQYKVLGLVLNGIALFLSGMIMVIGIIGG